MDLKFNEFPNWEKYKGNSVLMYQSATRVILFKPLSVREDGFIDVDKDNCIVLTGSIPVGIYDNKYSVNSNCVYVICKKQLHDYTGIECRDYAIRLYWDDSEYQANERVAPANILESGKFCDLNWMKLLRPRYILPTNMDNL
jgi:hypothetical protein